MNENINDAFRKTKAYFCLECGKCTSSCPVSIRFEGFSPRLSVKRALLGFEEDLLLDKNLWECLTCGLCNDVCMSDVKLPEFIRAVREEAVKFGNNGTASHCEIPHAVARLMVNPNLTQNRLGWMEKDMKFSNETGEYLFWTGCTPYFKTIFSDFDVGTDITKAALRILNHFEITPVILQNEKCCGHDMLWLGQRNVFEELREQNTEAIKNSKAEKIVTACAEGYHTLKNDYDLDAEVLHISQFLAQKIENNNVKFNKLNLGKVTYHDPCRLGRFSGEYEAPRKVLESLPGIELVEMERNKHRSTCCGVSAWINCNDFSREMRMNKLISARDTGAKTLVTSCPKCRIHLRCYTSNENVSPQIKLQVEDLTILAAKSLGLIRKGGRKK